MSVGRTHGTVLCIGHKSDGVLVTPQNWVGLSIAGTVSVESESFQDRELAEASVHQAGQGIGFSRVFDTAQFDTDLNSLLGMGVYATETDADRWAAVLAESPNSWQAMPVDLARPGRTASTTASIVRPWALSATGRGCHGTAWSAFGPTTAGTALDVGISAPDGTAIDDAVVGIIITATTGTVTNIAVQAGAHAWTFDANDIGIEIRDQDQTGGTFRITSTGGTVTGYALAGVRDPVPSG